ncbi:MAG: GNAT family N-acetyltransferase [Oscillospiraceae bacterium]|nr:GNAT family N-acetyltransferase [Oscillospiraceae bacterium]
MEIRFINQNDSLSEISNIYEKSWKYAYQNIIPQDYLDSIPKGRWADGIAKDGMNTLVLQENGLMIGTASICKSRWEQYHGYGEIVSIHFLPEYIGKGFGTHLLKRCIEELNKLGFNRILLWVLEDHTGARRFYEKTGFVCSEEYLNDRIGGKALREVLYFYHCDHV